MPRLEKALPKLARHKNQACIYLGGRRIYLGKFGSKSAQQNYDRVVAEWLAGGREPPSPVRETTVDDVLLAYLRHAKTYYRKNGEITNEVTQVKNAIRHVRALYGSSPADAFGPLSLECVRNRMVDADWSRKVINKQIGRVVRVFKWAASRQLVSPHVPEALKNLAGLKKGRTTARETAPVEPVSDDVVEQTLLGLPPIVADMVRLHRYLGCRPTELCIMRPCDINRSRDVWVYRPASHKTEHHQRLRLIHIGPQAQAVLLPYLQRDCDEYCFDPREACGARSNSKERYSKDSYGRAIRRAVHRINDRRRRLSKKPDVLELWSPNRLRHARASEIRQQSGLEGAQVVLGHANADVTEVYAQRDTDLAARIAKETG